VNSRGEFNVPWGAPKTDFILDRQNLMACSRSLDRKRIRFSHDDFEQALRGCRANDLVFMDPPYVTTHNNNGFVDYNEKLFSWADQVRLAIVAERLRSKGCRVLTPVIQ
jgi:DNA adenine methylase